MHGVHHPSADVDRLYAPCNEGGRGLQQIEARYKTCIVGLECYLRDSSDPYMQLVYECDSGRSKYSIKSMACRFTAQSRRDLAKDDTSQSLHGSGTVASDGVFEQAPQMDGKNCMENNGLACFECPKLEGVTSRDSDVHRNYTQDTMTLTRPSCDR